MRPAISGSAATLNVGDSVAVMNMSPNIACPAGAFTSRVAEADGHSVAVETPHGLWWFYRSNGHSYTGDAYVARLLNPT